MTHALKISDRAMFYALLLLVIFIPYSSAVIQTSLMIMLLAWGFQRFWFWKNNSSKGFLGSFSFPSAGLGWPLILIAILIVATIPFSHAPALSLKKFFSRFLQQIFLMYVTVEIINSSKRLYTVLLMLLWTMMVVNADVFFQLFSGQSFIFSSHMSYQRVTGPLRTANDLGSLLVTVIPLTLGLILTMRFWLPQIFSAKYITFLKVVGIALLGTMIMALGLTVSRGAWVAFIVTMVSGGIFLKKPVWTTIIIFFLVAFLLIFGIYFTNIRTDIFNKKVSQPVKVVEQKGAAASTPENVVEVQKISYEQQGQKFLDPSRRFEYWQTAMKVIKQYPLFGCGYNAYIQTLKKWEWQPVEYPHNSILHITAQLGLLGLLLHLWFLLALFWGGLEILKSISFHSDLHTLGTGIYLSIVAWMIHSLMDTPWESLQLSILWWFLVGVLLSLPKIAQSLKESKAGV